MGKRLDVVMHHANSYRTLQSLFKELCSAARAEFAPGNKSGIAVFNDSNATSCGFNLLDQPCRIRFDVNVADPYNMIGMAIFERVLPKEESRTLFTMYFDRLGNATNTNASDAMRAFPIAQPNYDSWFAILALEAFFADRK